MTKAEFRAMVLRHLGVIDETEAPNGEHVASMDPWIDGCRAELLAKCLCWWSADRIPTEVTPALTQFVGAFAASTFGRSGKGLDGEVVEAKARRRLAALKSSDQRLTTRALYY